MAAIVWSDVTNGAPELGVISNATFQSDILNAVNNQLDVTMFDGEAGFQTRLARIALAAHMATCVRLLGTGGPLSGEGVAGVASRNYQIPSSRSELLTTGYGRAFWQMIGTQAFGPRLL